jgi:hypothetical protein
MAYNFFRFLRRRNFVPNPRFQFILAGKGLSYAFLYGAVIVYASLQSMAETINILPLSCLTPEVKARLWALPTDALLLALLIALVVVLQIIQWSHRVAGPEFRLKRILREMAAGRYPESVKLRKHDCLKGLAENLTLLAHALRDRGQAHADQLAQLHGKVEECANHVRNGVRPDVVIAHLEGLATQICSLKQELVEGNEPGGADQNMPVPASQRVDSGSVPVSCGSV